MYQGDFCFFLILCSETHRKQDGAADTDQCCKRRKQRDDGRADAGACQGNISDLRDIPDINAINDAVKNVDKLREHKGDRGSQNQSRYRVVSEIIRVFFIRMLQSYIKVFMRTGVFCRR